MKAVIIHAKISPIEISPDRGRSEKSNLTMPTAATRRDAAAVQHRAARPVLYVGAEQAAKNSGAPVSAKVGAPSKLLGNAADIIISSPYATAAAVMRAANSLSIGFSFLPKSLTAPTDESPERSTAAAQAKESAGDEVPDANAGAAAARQRLTVFACLFINIALRSFRRHRIPVLQNKAVCKFCGSVYSVHHCL